MVKIDKIEHDAGYSFNITLNEGSFYIIFSGNLDLYWYYKGTEDKLLNINEKTFLITKENYFLYSLFEKLYESIKSYKIDFAYKFEFEELLETKRNELKEQDKNSTKKLFHDNMIDWHSDDYFYEEAARLLIEKLDEEFKVTFVKGRTELVDQTFSIRISNSGSRYNYFNTLFMKMYHEFIDYEPGYYQIHLEEYLYHLKLQLKKESQ